MYRLMILDDDVIIRKGLSTNIPWANHGFDLIGTAGDGEEGLALFNKTLPQIIISDIKMPFVDGLEMSRRVLREHPKTKIILLTGYEDFYYAKQALELKVFDYILKPVDFKKLLNKVLFAAATLDNEAKLEWQTQESRPLLRQRFLANLINGKFTRDEEIIREATFVEIPFLFQSFIVLLIKVDDYQNSALYPEMGDQELLKLKIASICRRILTEDASEVFDPGGDELVLIWGQNGKPEEIIQQATELGENIRQHVDAILPTTVTVGVGTVSEGLLTIPQSYQDAKTAMDFRHIIGKNQVLTIGNTEMPIADPIDLPNVNPELILKVKLGMTQESLDIIAQTEQQLLSGKFIPLSTARLFGMEITVMLLKEAETISNDNDRQKHLFEFSSQIQAAQTIAEIFSTIRQLIIELTEDINKLRSESQTGVVSQAVRYIESRFADADLSLTEIAQQVHVSPIYLSILFKKERNINFSDYLTEVRMRKAMELLRNFDLKTYEVADQVGYSNPQYFSVCFKRYTGFSPSEFKRQ